MRLQDRNCRTFWYDIFNGHTTNEYGESVNAYTEPKPYRANINAVSSKNIAEYGVRLQGSITILTTDMRCPISEKSRLWVDIDIDDKPNYVVTSLTKSLNVIKIIGERV